MASGKQKKEDWRRLVPIIIAAAAGALALAFLVSWLVGLFMDAGNVAVISINGPIMIGTDAFSESVDPDTIAAFIEDAEADDSIKAIIVSIDSPGGAPVASEEIKRKVEGTEKYTVALIRDVGASGAYWVATGADTIVASPISATGSIGVYGSYLGWEGLMERYNVTYNRLVAGAYKDLGSPYKELTEEEGAIFQRLLDDLYGYFVADVARSRRMDEEEVERLATGELILGQTAYEEGLVDELGSWDEAIALVEDRIGEEATLVYYEEEHGLLDLLSGILADPGYAFGRGFADSLAARQLTARTRPLLVG
ncbi:signal peptide peptidase SppA [Candidatus Woesearchaeota archaeon]|nr:signal peptide peptidase SppA [Candidatus Woesearchaeota archaeon]